MMEQLRTGPPPAKVMNAYEILAWLAEGGMAELQLARARHGELVALKRMLPVYANSTRSVDQFLDEARLLARLDHPHIARLVDFGMLEGDYAMALEYIHGQSLRSTLRRTDERAERFPLAAAVRVARDIASALHHAHERRFAGALLGVVHCDVSPSNIMISYTGDVKLIDFGVAKTLHNSFARPTRTLQGTPRYMSPEQVRGAPLDRRSDVFSLGVVLWEMITMRPLFAAEDERGVLQRILHSRPSPPSSYSFECPAELDQITARALAYWPDARYQTAAELLRDLDRLAPSLREPSELQAHMELVFDDELCACEAADAGGTAELTSRMPPIDDEATSPDLWSADDLVSMASA